MIPNPMYDYDYGPTGPLAALQERAMFPKFSYQISPPKGWVPLVVQLDADIAAVLPDYKIAQVKEKFAELCYYIGSYGIDAPLDDPRIARIQDLIAEATVKSKSMCQMCGQPSYLRTDAAWYATLCDAHVDVRKFG